MRVSRLFRWRPPIRIDMRRAVVAMAGATGALAMALGFFTHDPADKQMRAGFGWEMRMGTIITVPAVGDECGRRLFDNDTGDIWLTKPVSCIEAFGLAEKSARATADVSHVMLISQTFRR
jgi:hypothetical protein